jgi:hypothetical protein
VLIASLVTLRPGARNGLAAEGVAGAVETHLTLLTYAALPLAFEANRGQTDKQVRFLARAEGVTLFLTPQEMVLSLPSGKGTRSVVRLRLAGSSKVEPVGLQKLPGKVNYLIGKHRWTNIPTYGRVVYRNIYPHTDLMYYGMRGSLEYDWVLHPGANPHAIDLRIDGGSAVRLDGRGNLVLDSGRGVLRQARPEMYQVVGGKRQVVDGRYVLAGSHDVRIAVGKYDGSKPLIVDPVLSYATYIGGNGDDLGRSISVDGAGNAYVAGYTASTTNFPRVNARQSSNAGGADDAFVTAVAADGKSFLYSTYVGGTGEDKAYGIAVDAAGNAYVAGFTDSTDFPAAPSGTQATHGSRDIFALKLDPTGANLLYSTLLGGTGDDEGTGIAIDASGDAFISSTTNSPPSTSYDARMDALYPNGSPASHLVFGSGGDDGANGIAVDSQGNVWETGYTGAAGFPTVNGPVQNSYQGGTYDEFVTEIHGALTQPTPTPTIIYSTYLGSPGLDVGSGIAVDNHDNVYVTGYTDSPTAFPHVNAFQSSNNGVLNAFIAKFTGGATPALAWSTYYGGSGIDHSRAIAVDAAGDAIVAGYTTSTDLPVSNAVQGTYGGGTADAFVLKVNASGTGLIYSTYLGGSGEDYAYGVARDFNGNAYVTGYTTSAGFSTVGAAQGTNNGGADAFAAKITDPSGIPTSTPTSTMTPTPTITPTPTATTTATATNTATPTATATATATPPATATFTPAPTSTPVPTSTSIPTVAPTATPTSTPIPPPKTPAISISPSSPTAGENFKITVDTSPGADVSVKVKVKAKINKKTKTLYELDLTGKAKGNGRFGRTRKLDYFPSKPTTATASVKVSNAGGSKSKSKSFTIQPAKKTKKKKPV